MGKYIYCFIFLLYAFNNTAAFAQKANRDFAVRFAPLALMEPQGGPVFGVEYFIDNQWSVGIDIGAVLYSLDINNDEIGNPTGIKLKPEMKYYFDWKSTPQTQFYLSVEGLYNRTHIPRFDELQGFDNMGNNTFNYIGGYSHIKVVKGASMKFGLIFPFSKNNSHFYGETYFGLGIRNKQNKFEGIPSGVAEPTNELERNNVLDFRFNGNAPSVPMGFKCLYFL